MKKFEHLWLASAAYVVGLGLMFWGYRFVLQEMQLPMGAIVLTGVWAIGSVYFWLRISQHLNERAWRAKLKKAHACPFCKSEAFEFEKGNDGDLPTTNERLAPGQEAFVKPFVCAACGETYDGFLYYKDERAGFAFGGVLYVNLTSKKRRFNNPIEPLQQFRFRRQFFLNGITAGVMLSLGLFFLLTGMFDLGVYPLVLLGVGGLGLLLSMLNIRAYVI